MIFYLRKCILQSSGKDSLPLFLCWFRGRGPHLLPGTSHHTEVLPSWPTMEINSKALVEAALNAHFLCFIFISGKS